MVRDAFISFSSKDRQIAEKICHGLETRGISCWMSSRDVGLGDDFARSIVEAVESAQALVLVFSGNANNSDQIKKELMLASDYKLPLLPVRIEDVMPTGAYKYLTADCQYLDIFENWDYNLARLVERIAGIKLSRPSRLTKSTVSVFEPPPVPPENSSEPDVSRSVAGEREMARPIKPQASDPAEQPPETRVKGDRFEGRRIWAKAAAATVIVGLLIAGASRYLISRDSKPAEVANLSDAVPQAAPPAPIPTASPAPVAAPASAPAAEHVAVAAPVVSGSAAEDELGLTVEQRQSVQRWLTLLGFDSKGSDGRFGPATRLAISAYQKAKGQTETGYLTSDLALALTKDGKAAETHAALVAAMASTPPVISQPRPESVPSAFDRKAAGKATSPSIMQPAAAPAPAPPPASVGHFTTAANSLISGAWAVCNDRDTLEESEECALAACAKNGPGEQCQTIRTCSPGSHAAIAVGENGIGPVRRFGFACSPHDTVEASALAINVCNSVKNGWMQSDCIVQYQK